jgi:group II intron reverse transcriptase/maturase
MQSAGTVVEVLRARGRRGLPCERLYRQLFNTELFLMAWGRIYANDGAMTPGINGETADGMSLAKIGRIIDALRHERYRFQPVKRVYIPKKNGTKRPLGLPSWSDKLVGEVVRILLEAYYEPRFSGRSHGFRPGRGCHTALTEVANTWKGTTWFIEGDISDCFGSLDHEVMISVLAEHIHDNRFLRLIKGMLRAGYLEDWIWNATLSGAPQGGVVSPVLSNIYLDRLDKFAETVLIPEYTRGTRRKANPAGRKVDSAMAAARERKDRATARKLRQQRRGLPYGDPRDPGYRRLRYIRYADDHLLGFTGPKAEAEEIKQRLARFLREELKLELSADKTLITHARTQKARFLGYDIIAQHSATRPAVNGVTGLRVPRDVITAKQAPHLVHGTPWFRPGLLNLDDLQIVSTYGSEYRGLVQYYLLAGNAHELDRLHRTAQVSMLKTLGAP